jgi:phage FluMu protein Com
MREHRCTHCRKRIRAAGINMWVTVIGGDPKCPRSPNGAHYPER